MLHPSTKLLIDKLSEMTRKQRVSWDEGENGHIIHDTEGYRVILSPAPHTVMLTDVLGKEIETCTPEDIAAEADQGGRPYSQFVAELYREAGRHARGTERAIDAVLRGLDLGTDDEPTVAEAAPIVELTGSEIIEDLTDESDPVEFGELPMPDDDLPVAGEEIEGENEMTRAVEAMADEVNGHEPVAAEPAEEDAPQIEVPNFGAALLSDPEIAYDTTDMDSPTLSDPEIEVETDTLPAPEPEVFVPALYAETDEPVEQEPEPLAEPVAPPPANRVSPMGGSGFFGSSLGDLSRYRTQKLVNQASTEDTAPEAEAPEPIAATPPEDIAAPETTVSAEPEEPNPVASGSSERKFSLSGMTTGFGLGTPAHIEPAVEPEPIVEMPVERPKMIDGTVDLPDYPSTDAPVVEAESPVLPSFDKPLTQQEEPESETPDRDWIVRDEPTETAAPEATEPEPEEEAPKAKKPTPFNPWN